MDLGIGPALRRPPGLVSGSGLPVPAPPLRARVDTAHADPTSAVPGTGSSTPYRAKTAMWTPDLHRDAHPYCARSKTTSVMLMHNQNGRMRQ